jgi:hypothetical protein
MRIALALSMLVACGGTESGPDVDAGGTDAMADAAVDAPSNGSWLDNLDGRWRRDRVECHSGGCESAWFGSFAAVEIEIAGTFATVDWLDAGGTVYRQSPARTQGHACIVLAAGEYMDRAVSESALCLTTATDTRVRFSFLIARTSGGQDDWDVYLTR